MRLYTTEAKLVEAAIKTGALDRDLKALRKTIDQRLRESYKVTQEEKDKFVVGSLWQFREDMQLRHAPQYLKGAIVEVLEAPASNHHYNNYWSRSPLKILEFKRKPRGGFGSPPLYDVGSTIGWYFPTELIPYNSEEDQKKLKSQIEKIRAKHGV